MKWLVSHRTRFLIVFICLFASLLIYVIFFFNLNSYKSWINQYVNQTLQRKLAFDGAISLASFPKIGIILKNISLSDVYSDQDFITVEHVHLTLPFKALIRTQLIIDEAVIQGMTVRLLRFADGRTNIDDLLTTDENVQAFAVKHVKFKEATLVMHDALANKQVILRGLNFNARQITNKLVDTFTLKASGRMADLANKNTQNFAISLGMPNMQFENRHFVSSFVKLAIKITRPEQKIYGTLFFSNMTTDWNDFKSKRMLANLASKSDTKLVKVRINSPLSGNLSTQTLHLPALQTSFVAASPGLSDLPINGTLSGNFLFTGLSKKIQANLAGKLASSDFQGSFTIAHFGKPSVHFDIVIDQIDLNQWLSVIKKNNQQIKTQPFDISHALLLPQEWMMNGSLHIDTLQANDLTVSGMTFATKSSSSRPSAGLLP